MINAIRAGVVVLCFLFPTMAVVAWVGSAKDELAQAEASTSVVASGNVAVAAAADQQYCTPELKRILRRVLKSCGLLDLEHRPVYPRS
jgi:hypothetical protein